MSDSAHKSDTISALQQRNRELSILNVIAESLNSEVDLSRALHTTLTHVVELFHLRTGWIWLLQETQPDPDFYLAAALNLPPALTKSPKKMEGWCYCRESYQAGDMAGAANVNVVQCSRLKGLVKGTDGLRYHASVPLYAHGKPLGILNVVGGDWRELSPDDLRLLYTVGDLLSIAIERARLFARSTALGAAEERNRLAREIHDTLAQGLSATALQLELADALLETDTNLNYSDNDTNHMRIDHARQTIQRALSLTRANLEEARRSVLDLRAAPLEGQALGEALRRLAQDMTAQTGLKANVEVIENANAANRLPLSLSVEFGLYRISQEAIANAVRHSQAKTLTVRLQLAAAAVDLVISDDGLGFDSAHVPAGRFGLIGISERARLLGGTAELCSTPGSGTVVHVHVPLNQQISQPPDNGQQA